MELDRLTGSLCVSSPYETSRSVYSLLQICYSCAGRSADNLQIICRMSAECLQNISRRSAERLQRRFATSLLICRHAADEIILSKSPQNAPIKQRSFKRQTEEVGLLFIKSKHYMYENAGRDAGEIRSGHKNSR